MRHISRLMQTFCGGGTFYPIDCTLSSHTKGALDRSLDSSQFVNVWASASSQPQDAETVRNGSSMLNGGGWSRLIQGPQSYRPPTLLGIAPSAADWMHLRRSDTDSITSTIRDHRRFQCVHLARTGFLINHYRFVLAQNLTSRVRQNGSTKSRAVYLTARECLRFTLATRYL